MVASSGEEDAQEHTFEMKKCFEVAGAAHQSHVTVQASGHKADPGQQFGGSYFAGSCKVYIYLVDADGVNNLLYSNTASFGTQNVLEEEDLNSYITKTGTYCLRFVVKVTAAKEVTVDWDYYEASVARFHSASLMVNDTTVAYEIVLTEVVTPTERFLSGVTLIEEVTPVEHFTVGKTTPHAATDEKLLCSKTDDKVYEFEQGAPTGRFDTRDEDFGLPGQDKTLEKVTFESPAEAPHTVSVYVSTDAGLTWILQGQRTVSLGVEGVVSVWKTTEKFSVSFRGDGLQLSAFSLYAIPRGPEAPVED